MNQHPTGEEMDLAIAHLLGAKTRKRSEPIGDEQGGTQDFCEIYEWTDPLGMMGDPYPDYWEPLPTFHRDLNACTYFMEGNDRFVLMARNDGRWAAESGYVTPGYDYDQPTRFYEDTPAMAVCVAYWYLATDKQYKTVPEDKS